MSCCSGRMPSASSMVKDMANTALNAIRMASRTGEILAQDHLIRQRITICNDCEYKTGVRCLKCGCFLSLKTGIAAATCPVKKW